MINIFKPFENKDIHHSPGSCIYIFIRENCLDRDLLPRIKPNKLPALKCTKLEINISNI